MTTKSNKALTSKRASILTPLLDDINNGEYSRHNRYAVFGTTDDDHPLTTKAKQIVKSVHTHVGRAELGKRTSLTEPPTFKAPFLTENAENAIALILASPLPPEQKEESIDDALAREMLGKLPQALDRALRLDKIEVPLAKVPQPTTSYFYEAHRCYLYGFEVACVVVCRAIIEASLQSVCDPKRQIKSRLQSGQSYIDTLVKFAEQSHLLSTHLRIDIDGVERNCAIYVRNAGNDAIHDFQKFDKEWKPKIENLLLWTRMVLEDLYKNEEKRRK